MSRPWFPFYFADYVAKTEHLSLAEHGAYLLLMGTYYKTGCKLPANAMQLQKICRAIAPDEVDAMHAVLKQFFELDGDHYIHSRIEDELQKSNEISEKRSKAAQKRYKKPANADAKAGANDDAKELQLHTQSQPQSQKDINPPYPPMLNVSAWENYLAYRREAKFKKLKPTPAKKLMDWLITQGDEEIQKNIVEQTIRNQWQGLFELKGGSNANQQQTSGSKPSLAERATAARREFEDTADFDNDEPLGKTGSHLRA